MANAGRVNRLKNMSLCSAADDVLQVVGVQVVAFVMMAQRSMR